MIRARGLVRHLRSWGLKVEVVPGWQNRGRPYNYSPRAIMVHHTASGRNSGNFAAQNIVTYGRSDLPGPLSQFMLGRDGTVKVIAAGYSNHAGYGGPLAGIPRNMGNTYSIGIEAENDGLGEPWSKAQLNAYYRLCAALLVWMKIRDVSRVIGHKEWAFGRKIDPGGIDMDQFRGEVRKALRQGPSVKTVRLHRLQMGKRNRDVRMVKRRLANKGFFVAKNRDGYFGVAFRNAYSRWQKHLGYTGSDANGIPGKASLQKLGFKVLP